MKTKGVGEKILDWILGSALGAIIVAIAAMVCRMAFDVVTQGVR
jgi:integral membrane sensor domain MASE1